MSKQLEALKLALEALENLPEMCGIEEAITAVQEALASGANEQTAQVPVTDNTYGYAKSLAETIFKRHFASDEHYASGRIVWGVNDTAIGILTQIDNMVADMVRRPAQHPKDKATQYIKATLAAFGPGEAISMTQDTWAKLHETMSVLIDQPEQRQEPTAWTATRLWNRKDTWTCPADIEKDLLDGRVIPAQQQEPDRVKFERHWRKTRGGKKANRELPRHPLQPQTYIQDSANRHWVTWQAAVRSVSSPSPCPTCEALARTVMLDQTYHDAQRKPFVGLTDAERETLRSEADEADAGYRELIKATEAKLREKNNG